MSKGICKCDKPYDWAVAFTPPLCSECSSKSFKQLIEKELN